MTQKAARLLCTCIPFRSDRVLPEFLSSPHVQKIVRHLRVLFMSNHVGSAFPNTVSFYFCAFDETRSILTRYHISEIRLTKQCPRPSFTLLCPNGTDISTRVGAYKNILVFPTLKNSSSPGSMRHYMDMVFLV